MKLARKLWRLFFGNSSQVTDYGGNVINYWEVSRAASH